ncbi:MAG: V-type ATP synthase subunit E [Trueperaceae bacterium]|nr:MAG: V-type ATP synthase subunit E [Trueperaceae bacterium]
MLEREASAEIDAILSEARERASEIVAQAEAETESIKTTRARATAAQREATLVRARSAAQLQAAALKLRARHEAVESVFEAADARLADLASDAKAYEPVLTTLLQEAVAALGADAVSEVQVAKADVALATKIAKAAGLDVKVVAGPVNGGVRVLTARGSSVENTLHARLAALRGELASSVAHSLFATDPTEA